MVKQKMGWFEKRRYNRAMKERDVIEGTIYLITGKCEECVRNLSVKQKKVDSATQEVIAGYDSGTNIKLLNAMRKEIEMMEGEIELEEKLIDMFMTLRIMLNQMLIYVDGLIRIGDYNFVISIIPETKLPSYIKTVRAEELSEIVNIIGELLSSIEDRIALVDDNENRLAEVKNRVKGVAQTMRINAGKTGTEDDEDTKAFIARKKGITQFVEPVPAKAEENTSTQNTNLA